MTDVRKVFDAVLLTSLERRQMNLSLAVHTKDCSRSLQADELAQYSTHGIYDACYTSWVSGQDMVIRHLLLAPNRVYYLIDDEQIVIMGIVHVKRSPQAVTSMLKRFLEEYDK